MTPHDQQTIMLRFARCVFKHNANTYEEADCIGAAQIILRDYGKKTLPDDRTKMHDFIDILQWPTELKEFDVLMLDSYRNGFINHCGVYIGNDNVLHFGRFTAGMICNHLSRFEGQIVSIGRCKE